MADDDGIRGDAAIGSAHWQKAYHLALVEPDRAKLREHVHAAETAIRKRLSVISDDPNHQPEQHAIQDALSSLQVLKAEMQ